MSILNIKAAGCSETVVPSTKLHDISQKSIILCTDFLTKLLYADTLIPSVSFYLTYHLGNMCWRLRIIGLLIAVLSIYLFIFMSHYSLQGHVLNITQSLIFHYSEKPRVTPYKTMQNYNLVYFSLLGTYEGTTHTTHKYTLFYSDTLTLYQIL
jgi:hypothetical protein